MLNSNQKAAQAKTRKAMSDFEFILKQILNLDTQKKISKSWSIKSPSKSKEKEKSSTESLDLCLYCIKPGYIKNKYYYKHPERVNKDFW